jgi:hypothetical protein
MPNRFFQSRRLEPCLALATLALGFFHAWLGRYSMDPDGISYLDIGQSFFRRDWPNAVNSYWSPLYPWTLGLILGVVDPSPRKEFVAACLVNFVIFALALLAFRFLLHTLIAFHSEGAPGQSPDAPLPLPQWMMLTLGYVIFLWIALEVDPPWETTPDLAVLAFTCLAAGVLLRLHPTGKIWTFAFFGLILAAGYWTKAILFPLGFVTLAAAYWWKRSIPGWRTRLLIATLFFLAASAPLIFLLSHQKARFTFGDSGKLNYAWFISPRTFWRNWQGGILGSGIPAHPTRQLLRHPDLFEFDGPVLGTYPPWTDPSYWNEGLKWHFRLKPQLEQLATTTASEVRLLFRVRPDLITAVIILALLSGGIWLSTSRQLWPLLAISAVGMGIYLPLFENDRYLGGFVLVIFLTLFAAVRLRPTAQNVAAYVTLAVSFTMLLATADYTVRLATHHFAIPGTGPNSTLQDITAAEDLWQVGLHPGDKVAVIMNGTGAYWAHLAKVRIVAEIMETGHGTKEFWDSSPEVQQQVFHLFAQAHAKLAVTTCPPNPALQKDWQPLPATPYCIHRLN